MDATGRIQFIVDRLNAPPFRKGFATMADLDSKIPLELLDIVCEIVVEIDPDQDGIMRDPTDFKIQRIVRFLSVMKFINADDNVDDFHSMLSNGDPETLHTIMYWCLERFDHLKKRAYLAKYLMPIEVPPEFMNEDLVIELSQALKEWQGEFKEAHKAADQVRGTGARPAEMKAEITQMEQEKRQLKDKIEKMEKEAKKEGPQFAEMLKVTSLLRKEQEEEVRLHDRLRDYRKGLQEADNRLIDSNKRLSELRSSGAQTQTAEQLSQKLQRDVQELEDRKKNLEVTIADREIHLEKLFSWDTTDRNTTEDDVRMKRDEVRDLEDNVSALQEELESALERNSKLIVFKQASMIAMKKMREREDELEKLTDEKRRLAKQMQEKNDDLRARNKAMGGKSNMVTKQDLMKLRDQVQGKVEEYKVKKREIDAQRAELVVLQRTEQILKSRAKNLEEFQAEMDRKKGMESYNQRALSEMADKADSDMQGATLEGISAMVEEIGREFKQKQAQLNPLMAELKRIRQEFMDVESEYLERKSTYDKVAVGLELEKQALERDCDTYQDECLKEESRFHELNCRTTISKIKLQKADQEKKWQTGNGQFMRDFKTLKDFYANKLLQQDSSTKQLRKRKKELEEEYGARTNQKTNFINLQALLEAKLRYEESVNGGIMISGGRGHGSRGNSAGYGSRGNSANYGPGGGSRNNSLGPGRGSDVMTFDED